MRTQRHLRWYCEPWFLAVASTYLTLCVASAVAGATTAAADATAAVQAGSTSAQQLKGSSGGSSSGSSSSDGMLTRVRSLAEAAVRASLGKVRQLHSSSSNSERNCSLALKVEKGALWEYENCIYLRSGDGFTFHWTYDQMTHVLDGCFSAAWKGWLGWGVGVRMIGASAIVAYPSSQSGESFAVSRYFLAAYDKAEIRPNTGNLQLVNNSVQVHVVGSTGLVHVAFAAILPPEQMAGIYIVMAKGPGADINSGMLEQHDPALTARSYLRLTGGGGPPQFLQVIHGVANTLAWGVLVPLGVLVARHARDLDPLWLPVHRAVQTSAFVLGAFGFFLGTLMWGDEHGHRTRRNSPEGSGEESDDVRSPRAHRWYGVLLFMLACFQITALMIYPHKDALLRPWWNFLHHWNGRIIVLIAIINVWEGISLLHPAVPVWPWLYGVPLGLLVLAAVVLELFLLWRWLTDDMPTSAFQHWFQSVVPRSALRRYQLISSPQGSPEHNLEIDEAEIETMASRIQRELDFKAM